MCMYVYQIDFFHCEGSSTPLKKVLHKSPYFFIS